MTVHTATTNPTTADEAVTALIELGRRIDELAAALDTIEFAEDKIAANARAQQVPAREATRHADQISDAVSTAGGLLRRARASVDVARRRAAKLTDIEAEAIRQRR